MRTADITKPEEEEIRNVLDRMINIHGLIEDKKIAKRIYTRTHMISVVPIMAQSIKDGKSDEEMMEWFVTFYSGKKSATTSSIYNNAAGNGSGKKEAVKKRLEEIQKSYDSYFKYEKA